MTRTRHKKGIPRSSVAGEGQLRDWGIPIPVSRGEILLINDRRIEWSYDGVEYVAYDLPRDEFVRQVQRTTRVHQRMVAASGGHRPRLEADQSSPGVSTSSGAVLRHYRKMPLRSQRTLGPLPAHLLADAVSQ